MGIKLTVFVAIIALLPALYIYNFLRDVDPPVLPDYYWGPKSKEGAKEDTSIRPFKIDFKEDQLNDLKTRLKLEANRFAPPLEGIGFQYGFNTEFLKVVTQHWLNKYDWRAREKALNKYPQFKTTIAGIEIHFQHVKNSGSKKYKTTRPLLLIHGWPGSYVEYQKVIPLLTEPKDSNVNFELIVVSIPGYGFSEAAYKPGMGPAQVGQIFLKLMKRLGHEKFYVQGGDWGALIATDIATLYPKNVQGIHINTCISFHSRSIARLLLAAMYPPWFMDADEIGKAFPLSNLLSTITEESGYIHLQSTKPDTSGVALSNSPTGLAAYLLEKFASWTVPKGKSETNGGLVPHFNLDDLLDNVMVYWVSNSITSSTRMYSEFFNPRRLKLNIENAPVLVPSGCTTTPDEFWTFQNQWMLQDKFHNLIQYTKLKKGGHFTFFELPDIMAADVIKFVNQIETKGLANFN